MEILVASKLPRFPPFPKHSKKHLKSPRPQLLHCFRNSGESHDLVRVSSPRESGSTPGNEDTHQVEEKQSDIWKLFKEAQKNILYLNKQRLMAMEELDTVKKERDSLLERVEQLETKKKQENMRRDKLTMSSELLLRIDSLVLNGMIGSMEASDLRKLGLDSRRSFGDDFCDIVFKNDDDFLADLRHFSKRSKQNGFHTIHICTEMSPLVSVGSLGSYITGLSCALQRKGNLVEVILPKYACLNLDEVQGLREVDAEFYSYFNGQLHGNRIWTGVVYGIGVTFIEPVYYSSFFSHEKVYGYSNDFERFTYFSRASLDYLVKSGKRPDVLHIHNWQTSIIGPLFWDVFVNQGFEGTKILLTCQGFDSQCLEQPEKLALCGLDPSRLHRPDRLQDNNKSHLVNILKGGVIYSNKVIMMSSVQTKGQMISVLGHGLEPTLAIHKEKLVIAPHGLDKSNWDPSCDNFIPQNYSAFDMKGKSVCKVALQQHLNLPEGSSKILVGCIYSDILDIDLEKLKALVSMASRRDSQFIFMGSSQNADLSRAFEFFKEEVKGEDVRFIDEYDEELSHLIISGCDVMLCPSFDDPLLQVPLKAIKYGAAPVSVHLCHSRFRYFGDGDGDFESAKLLQYINRTFGYMSLGEAITAIKNNLSEWNRKIKDGMEKDFSWDSECADVHISAYAATKIL